MPKRYEFHSKLAPEEIFVRLEACARPTKWDSCDSSTFYYKRRKKGFSLTCTGKWGRGMLPFWAEVTEQGDGSRILGGFPVWRMAWQTVTLFFGFTVLMTPIFGIPLGMYPMIITMFLLAVPFYAGFWGLTNAVFYGGRRKAILEFIREHLLA